MNRTTRALGRAVGARRSLGYSAPAVLEQLDGATTFPREHEGLDYALNWSLNADGITPSGGAWGNADVKTLASHSSGTMGAGRTVNIAAAAVPKGCAPAVVDADEFSARMDDVQLHLSSVETSDIFVNDAAVGSYRNASSGIRVISDDAALSLFLSHMLVEVPSGRDPWHERPIVVYAASGIEGTAASLNLDTIEIPGESEDSEARAEVVGATVVLTGAAAAPGALALDAIAAAVASIDFDGVVMACDVHRNTAGSAALVFGGAAVTEATIASLYSAHHSVWSADGVASLWGGRLLEGKAPASAEAYDLVVGGVHVGAHASENLINHPKVAAFVAKKGVAAKAGKVVGAEAIAQLYAEHTGASAAHGALFAEAAASAGTEVHVVAKEAAVAGLL